MEMGTNFGSGLDFANFVNSAMNRDDGMFGNNSLLWPRHSRWQDFH